MRATNRSYAFFRVTGLSNEGEPVGAQGVPLTPGRSIAVDRVHEYGTPFFIEANLPIESVKPASPFRRLMIAQDTGSAIVGPARADLYLGAGDEAGRIAGRIRHPGRFVMLLPRELDMVAAGKEMPLPVPKPKIAALEVAKQDGKGKGGQWRHRRRSRAADGRQGRCLRRMSKACRCRRRRRSPRSKPGNRTARARRSPPALALHGRQVDAVSGAETEARRARSQEAGRQGQGGVCQLRRERIRQAMPLPVLKPKAPAIEAKKQDGKGKAESAGVRRDAAGGRQEPSPAPKSKTPGIEVKKQNGKGKAEAAKAGDVPSR